MNYQSLYLLYILPYIPYSSEENDVNGSSFGPMLKLRCLNIDAYLLITSLINWRSSFSAKEFEDLKRLWSGLKDAIPYPRKYKSIMLTDLSDIELLKDAESYNVYFGKVYQELTNEDIYLNSFLGCVPSDCSMNLSIESIDEEQLPIYKKYKSQFKEISILGEQPYNLWPLVQESLIGEQLEELRLSYFNRIVNDEEYLDLSQCYKLRILEINSINPPKIRLRKEGSLVSNCRCRYPYLDHLRFFIQKAKSQDIRYNLLNNSDLLYDDIIQSIIPSCSQHQISNITIQGPVLSNKSELKINFKIDLLCLDEIAISYLSIIFNKKVKMLELKGIDQNCSINFYGGGVVEGITLDGKGYDLGLFGHTTPNAMHLPCRYMNNQHLLLNLKLIKIRSLTLRSMEDIRLIHDINQFISAATSLKKLAIEKVHNRIESVPFEVPIHINLESLSISNLKLMKVRIVKWPLNTRVVHSPLPVAHLSTSTDDVIYPPSITLKSIDWNWVHCSFPDDVQYLNIDIKNEKNQIDNVTQDGQQHFPQRINQLSLSGDPNCDLFRRILDTAVINHLCIYDKYVQRSPLDPLVIPIEKSLNKLE